MKKITIILLLVMLTITLQAYFHVYSYQDFSDFENGERIASDYIPSNNDGTLGINDRWGENNEYTWPDVPGDTNFYLEVSGPLLINEIDGGNALHFYSNGEEKKNLGLRNVLLPGDLMLKVSYYLYIDEKETTDSAFVLFSSDLPGKKERMTIIYTDGKIKGIRTIRGFQKITEFEIEYNAYNRWREFSLEIWYRKEFRILINSKQIHKWKSFKPFTELPFLYIGNTVDKNNNAKTNTYIKYLKIEHFK